MHLASRFDPLRALDDPAEAEGLLEPDARAAAALRACSAKSANSRAERAELHAHVARGVPALAAALAAVSDDPAVRNVTLANYVEALGSFVVGRSGASAFVRDCCLGGWRGGGGAALLEP